MLAKLGLSRGLPCHDAVLGGRRRKTNAEVVASTADRPGSRLAASRLALVASELGTNQAVVHGTAGAPFFLLWLGVTRARNLPVPSRSSAFVFFFLQVCGMIRTRDGMSSYASAPKKRLKPFVRKVQSHSREYDRMITQIR